MVSTSAKPTDPSSIRTELEGAGLTPKGSRQGADQPTGFKEKRNFAQKLSGALARRIADELRGDFPGILPTASGDKAESRAPTGKGFKRLDVNYSTQELGLALGVSIKTFGFRDRSTDRYTKNYTSRDNELRAEAEDYHERQPFAVMVALIFLPADACTDGEAADWSSFAQAVEVFRWRTGRRAPSDKHSLFERLFIGVYENSDQNFGNIWFFDAERTPPRHGAPSPDDRLDFRGVVIRIRDAYRERNGVSLRSTLPSGRRPAGSGRSPS